MECEEVHSSESWSLSVVSIMHWLVVSYLCGDSNNDHQAWEQIIVASVIYYAASKASGRVQDDSPAAMSSHHRLAVNSNRPNIISPHRPHDGDHRSATGS